jgi:hypothetical protein
MDKLEQILIKKLFFFLENETENNYTCNDCKQFSKKNNYCNLYKISTTKNNACNIVKK